MPKDTPPPSMSVNLNAQGLDDIAELMKLMTKVNPDMINQPAASPAPTIEIEPMDKPLGGLGSLGNLDAGPLKMLPDLEKDEPHAEPDADNMGGPSDMDADNMPPMGDLDRDDGDDGVDKAHGDIDNDGDHDMHDHELEKKDDKPEEEAFGNSLNGSEPEYSGIDAAVHDGNDLNKSKQMTKHSYRGGDNPMAMPESKEQLRASIREELLQRLSEAKGAK
jgi:hypothetical protein